MRSSSFYKNLFWAISALVLASLLFSVLFQGGAPPRDMSLNELARAVNERQVQRIGVNGDDLKVQLKDGGEAVSKKEAEAGLTETLVNFGVEPSALNDVQIAVAEQSGWQFWAGVLIPAVLPILFIGFIFWLMFRQARTGVNQAFSFGRSTVRLSTFLKEKVVFADVAGLKEAKEELTEVVEFLKSPKKFLDIGARIPRGVLLVGLPGTGKTLLARAVSGESNVPFFHVSASEFVEMFVGVGASVSGDTPVLIKDQTGTRLMPIGEFADKHYKEGEEGLRKTSLVQTLGYTPLATKFYGARSKEKKFFGGSKWTSVEGVYRHKVNELYTIHYRGGKLRTTGDHSIFVRSGNMVIAKKASELAPGDILVNLPFKVRSSFVPGFGTTHKVRAHQFADELQGLYLNLYSDELQAATEKYEFVMAQRGVMTQARTGAAVGMAQGHVKDWQIHGRGPRFLNEAVVRHGTPPRLDVTEGIMKLLGYYTAEGNATKYATCFTFGLHEKDLHADCARLIRETFNLESELRPLPETNSFRISISSGTVSKFFEKQCGTGSHRKHVPEILWSLTKPYFLAYLDGYTQGDGYTTQEGKLSAASVSKQLILELAWLSAMHGIQVGIREEFHPEGRPIQPGGKPLPPTTSWNLIIGKTAHPFSEVEAPTSGGQFKKPIVQRIEKEAYDGYVYDLCGCENEAFFGGEKPVLLHNSRIRDSFSTARKAAPAILFIDEIDAVGRQRGAGLGGGNDEREQTLNQILVELDGFDRETQVIVLAATNRPDILDPALLRPGRFDRRVILDLPDLNDRQAILKVHAKGKNVSPDVDFAKIAARTPGSSGADLANLVNEAALLAARRNKTTIDQLDFFEAVEKVLLGPERRGRVISKGEKEITAYHEGGHALVAASLKGADPVHKVSIISRGMALGYTMKLPTEEQRLRTRTQYLTDLAMMLGGFASEKMTFNDVSTGASNDLKEATDLARRMVTKYGMSEAMGPQTFGSTEEMVFLGRELTAEKNYSDTVAQRIDDEVSRFISTAFKTAQEILKRNKRALQKLAKTLMEKETLEQEEFYALLKPFRIKPVTISA